jgi:hypothetical protein
LNLKCKSYEGNKKTESKKKKKKQIKKKEQPTWAETKPSPLPRRTGILSLFFSFSFLFPELTGGAASSGLLPPRVDLAGDRVPRSNFSSPLQSALIPARFEDSPRL